MVIIENGATFISLAEFRRKKNVTGYRLQQLADAKKVRTIKRGAARQAARLYCLEDYTRWVMQLEGKKAK